MQRLAWLIVSAGLLAGPAFAFVDGETRPARLVADLAPGSVPIQGSISGFTRLGSRAVFLRGEPDAGLSLWITDGTVEGTSALGVLCPPCQTAVALGSNGNVAFYKVDASYPVYETAIWRTDGTPAGTFPLTNDLPMATGSPPAGSIRGGLLFFTACTPELGCELWSSDGSREGTAPVGEIVPGPGSADIQEIAAAGDRAFLIVGVPGGYPAALWVADGTARGLQRLRTAPEAKGLVAGADRAFFLAWNGRRWEVWASDGTAAGTRPVTRLGQRARLVLPENATLTLLGGRVWFVADDGAHGFELWSADMQPGSLRRASDFQAPNPGITDFAKAGDRIVFVEGGYSGSPKLWSSRRDFRSAAQLTGCPGGCPEPIGPLASLDAHRLVFYGHDREGGGIWVTDGTAAGTRLLQRTVERSLSQAVSLDGLALIEITEEYETGQLWVTDGTAAGTSLVTQGGPYWSHYYGWVGRLQAGTANGRLIFTGIAEAETGAEELLWRSDGSPAGSWPLLDSKVGRSTPLQQLTPFRDGLLVQSCNPEDDGTWRQEMRFVQGAEATLLISRASEYCTSTVAVDLGDAAVFVKSESEPSVWRTDGTPAGTAALIPGSAVSLPAALARFGEEAAIWLLLFPAPGVSRSELWLTDGTPGGTRRHLDLPDVKAMYGLTDIGGRLLFFNYVESGEAAGLQPWVSDGTRAGTHPLTGAIGYTADQLFIDAGGRVYFLFGELGGPVEIWGTDGTDAGTGPAVTAASGAFEPQRLSAAGGRLYFAAPRASDPEGRLLPWVSDGTDGSTELLADLTVGEPIFAPLDRSPFVELDGRVWFAASDPGIGGKGDELWSTDGTPEGTARLLDIAPGLLGSYPRSLAVWNGRLWFRARDAVHGMELWTSDGTAEGTRLVHDIAPGPSWSTPGALDWLSPVDLTGTETGLYFPASDGEHGRELWVLPAGEL
ncbi:MAG: ELWxxDGT repeat protein [Thermoanaerobaculia bacterium]